MILNLVDIYPLEYYSDSLQPSGLHMLHAYRCKINDGVGISSYGASDWCCLHTLGVF